MPKRSKTWDEYLAEKLQNLDFAKGFLTELINEGNTLQEALAATIRGYGVKEFAELVDMTSPAVQRTIAHRHNPTKSTLEKLLKPFGLELGVSELGNTRK